MKLSPHFTLAELTASQTASRRGWRNDPAPSEVAALRTLCERVLEPARAYFGKPVVITSGYRAPRLNKLIGGAPTSQHTVGQAADFHVPGVSNGAVAVFVRDYLDFDQLILEAYTPGIPASGWVHVSYRDPIRRDVRTATPRAGGGMVYSQGLRL